MSSTIHKYKVTEYSVKELATKEIYNYCFGFSAIDFHFGDWLDRLRVEVDNADELDFDAFFSILSEHYHQKGLSFFDLIFRIYKDEFENLKQEYDASQMDKLASAEALLWHHIFADLSIDGFSKLPLKELKIEIAQVEDGIVAFPGENEKEYWGEQYREFLTRLLSNFPDSGSFDFPIGEWLEKDNHTFNEIIWGVKEEERILITDNNSLENHPHRWWHHLLHETMAYKTQHNGENWITSLQEYPFEVVTVYALIHNSLFNNIEDVIKNNEQYDSTAYFLR